MFTAVMFCLHECTSALIIDCTLPPYAGHWRLQSGVLQLHHLLYSDQEGQTSRILENKITPAENKVHLKLMSMYIVTIIVYNVYIYMHACNPHILCHHSIVKISLHVKQSWHTELVSSSEFS